MMGLISRTKWKYQQWCKVIAALRCAALGWWVGSFKSKQRPLSCERSGSSTRRITGSSFARGVNKDLALCFHKLPWWYTPGCVNCNRTATSSALSVSRFRGCREIMRPIKPRGEKYGGQAGNRSPVSGLWPIRWPLSVTCGNERDGSAIWKGPRRDRRVGLIGN